MKCSVNVLFASSGYSVATWRYFAKPAVCGRRWLLPVFGCLPQAYIKCSHWSPPFPYNALQQYGNPCSTFHYGITCLGRVLGIYIFLYYRAPYICAKGFFIGTFAPVWDGVMDSSWLTFLLLSSRPAIYLLSAASYLCCRCGASKKFSGI